MGTLFRMFAPLGRLYDPLLELAERVHAALARRSRIVWADEKGCVFVDDPGQAATAPRTLIGTYDSRTPLSVIENDLRLALRERASHWILDWNVVGARPGDARQISAPKSQRRSRRRVTRALVAEASQQRTAPSSVVA